MSEEIVFDEAAHTYTRNGITAPCSVTGLISNHFPKFKPVTVVDDCFDNWKRKSHSKYHDLIHSHTSDANAKQAILDMWENNRNEACRLGTATHKAVELLLGGAPLETCGNPEVQDEINAFLAWHAEKREKGWELVATELVVGLTDSEDKLCLGGSIDAIFKDGDGEHVLVDWKRTKDPFGPDEDAPFAKVGSGPLSALKDSKFNKYAVQLAVYAQMLKRQRDIDVGDRRYLVRLTKSEGAQEICAAGEVFDKAATGLLRVAADEEEDEEDAKEEGEIPTDPDELDAYLYKKATEWWDSCTTNKERRDLIASVENVSSSGCQADWINGQIKEQFREWGYDEDEEDEEDEGGGEKENDPPPKRRKVGAAETE